MPPTGLGLKGNTLYVADSLNNRIAAISNALNRTTSAGTGRTVSSGGSLNDPLAIAIAFNGDILTTNADDGFLITTNPGGVQISKALLDNTGSPPGSGTLFGIAVAGAPLEYRTGYCCGLSRTFALRVEFAVRAPLRERPKNVCGRA